MSVNEKTSMIIKVIAPVIIGIAVVVWLFHREFSVTVLQQIHFTSHVIGSIFLAWMFMIGRDFGLTWRFRALTDGELTWRQALRVDMLCEFTSCITPSAVGGGALGMIYLNREGIAFGRATTLMMTTLFLDELFFVIACPIIALLIPHSELFGFGHGKDAFTTGLEIVFWCVYGVLFAWTLILFLGIIAKPHGVKIVLTKLFQLPFLRRWSHKIAEVTDNMVATSAQLKKKPLKWWLETFGASALSWTSRFLVVNALFWGFVPGSDQLVVLGRQFVVWVALMASPTPGGSGVSEWLFTEYYGDMISAGVAGVGIALIIALFWRLISYYVYLVIGVCLLPDFFSRKRTR